MTMSEVIDGIVARKVAEICDFINSAPLTKGQRIAIIQSILYNRSRDEMPTSPAASVTFAEFVQETGLDPEFQYLDSAYQTFKSAGQPFWEWWRDHQIEYV